MQDGPAVRLGFALMAPVVPLLVISSCLIFEIFSTGSGITAMLKAWTFSVFFLMKSRYAGKDGSTEQETCSTVLFKIFVKEGRNKESVAGQLRLNWNTFPLFLFRTRKLQAITILYIGGASGTSSLLTCQELDGNHDASATFRCILIIFLPVLAFVWPSGFVFPVSCSCPFAKKCMKECYVRRLTVYKMQKQPALIRCILWNCLSLQSFGYICSHFCRFESLFWMPRCCPKFPISGTPSGWLHLPISHTCHPVYGAHEHEDLGGYYWLCLRVWLRCRDSYFHALPLLSPARSATFQPNDQRGICHLWRWYQSFLAWSQRFYHGENLATGQGCFCLSDCCYCIWLNHWTCAMVGWRNKS